jgi:hypothetical protein
MSYFESPGRTNMTQLTLNLGQQTKLTVLTGDCAQLLPSLETESIQCCVTSPPYWGLRDYDHPNQIGAEPSPEQYVQNLVDIFRLVRKTLRPEGTLWLNVGDGYARNGGTGKCGPNAVVGNTKKLIQKRNCKVPEVWGLKDRDLMGLPWRVAFALQADGWIGSTSRWGQDFARRLKPGVDYEKPAKAQLPDRMIAGDIVRFNTLFVPTGRFNPRRCIHAPNLNYTQNVWGDEPGPMNPGHESRP